jgi:hypothetical protein
MTIIEHMSRRTLSSPSPVTDAVVIRPVYPDDAAALERLAALDSRRPLAGPAFVAERDGRILAAISLADDRTIADPFVPTADLIALLRVHAAETAAPGRRQVILRRSGTSTRRRPALARG